MILLISANAVASVTFVVLAFAFALADFGCVDFDVDLPPLAAFALAAADLAMPFDLAAFAFALKGTVLGTTTGICDTSSINASKSLSKSNSGAAGSVACPLMVACRASAMHWED